MATAENAALFVSLLVLVLSSRLDAMGGSVLNTEIEFLDKRKVEHTHFLSRQVTPVKKYDKNPILPDGQPIGVVQEKGTTKLWYTKREFIAGELVGGRFLPFTLTMRYVESEDAVNFKAVQTGEGPFKSDTENNIVALPKEVLECIWDIPCVFPTEGLPHAKGKYALFSRQSGFLYSDDGWRWNKIEDQERPNPAMAGGSDTCNKVFYDTRYKAYVMYYRPHWQIHAGWSRVNRLIARVETKDLRHWNWGDAQCVLDTDWRDAPAVRTIGRTIEKARGRDKQIQSVTVVPYKDLYLGFVGYLDDTNNGHHETRLYRSYDGINWDAENDKTPLIAPGEYGQWDAGAIYTIPQGCPIIRGDKLVFYYAGSNMTHGYLMRTDDKIEKRHIGLGTIQRGRMVGYQAGEMDEGELLTRPFILTGSEITINADTAKGELFVGVQRAEGNLSVWDKLEPLGKDVEPLGYTRKDFDRIIGVDDLDIPLKWQGKNIPADLVGKKIRLRIALKNATIYGISMSNPTGAK